MWDNLYYKPERAKIVDFVTYMAAGTGALVAADNPRRGRSIDNLCGLSVSFGAGSSMEIAVRKQDDLCKSRGSPAINTIAFQDLASGLLRLDSGRTDVMLWDLAFVDNLAQTARTKYTRAFAIMDGHVIGAAVQKGQPDLLKALHDGVSVMQKNGTQKKIFQKYGVDPSLIVSSEQRIE